jgi:translation initiation factor IF-3
VNFKIRVPQVRVLDSNGNMLGVMPTQKAQSLADQAGLDLVEITPNAFPPVCKIMDYGKFRYEESIKAKKARKAQKVQQVKEIKFHPGTDVGDLEHKLRQIRQFLADGNKVKLTLQYRGRENVHRELGEDMIARVLESLQGECTVEQAPKTLGRVHGCLIGPPRKNAKFQNQQEKDKGAIHISVSGGDAASDSQEEK